MKYSFPTTPPETLKLVLTYWEGKAKKLGRPNVLFRLFPQLPASNQDPYVAFRPRTSEAYSLSQIQKRTPIEHSKKKSVVGRNEQSTATVGGGDDDEEFYCDVKKQLQHHRVSQPPAHRKVHQRQEKKEKEEPVHETSKISPEEYETLKSIKRNLMGAKLTAKMCTKREELKRQAIEYSTAVAEALIDSQELHEANIAPEVFPSRSYLARDSDESYSSEDERSFDGDNVPFTSFVRTLKQEAGNLVNEETLAPLLPLFDSELVAHNDASDKPESNNDTFARIVRDVVARSYSRIDAAYRSLAEQGEQPTLLEPLEVDKTRNEGVLGQLRAAGAEIFELPVVTGDETPLTCSEEASPVSATELAASLFAHRCKIRIDRAKQKSAAQTRMAEDASAFGLDGACMDGDPVEALSAIARCAQEGPVKSGVFYNRNRATVAARPRIDRSGRLVFDVAEQVGDAEAAFHPEDADWCEGIVFIFSNKRHRVPAHKRLGRL